MPFVPDNLLVPLSNFIKWQGLDVDLLGFISIHTVVNNLDNGFTPAPRDSIIAGIDDSLWEPWEMKSCDPKNPVVKSRKQYNKSARAAIKMLKALPDEAYVNIAA